MRFHLIDALRGIAALWVVFYHAYSGNYINELTELLPNFITYIIFEKGRMGVPIFFVISGFVIAHSITKDHVDGLYLAKFTLRRSIRLDPPYWGSIVFIIGMAWVSSIAKHQVMEWPSIKTIAAHLFYTQEILNIEHINLIYWTLCLEIQFYLIFCMLVFFTQQLEKYYQHIFITVYLTVAIISLLWPTRILLENLYSGLFLPYWYSFLLGVFAYWSWKKRIPSFYFYIYSAIILSTSYFTQSHFSSGSALTAIFVHECAKLGCITSLNWRWLQFLGKISYSLYLTHSPVMGASYYISVRFFGNSIVVQLFSFLGSTAICIIFAFLFWWVFESWSIQLSKKITLHRAIKK